MVNYGDVFIIEKGIQISYSKAHIYPAPVIFRFCTVGEILCWFFALAFFLQEDAEAKKAFIFNTASVRCCCRKEKNE